MLFHLSLLDKRKFGGDSCYLQHLQSYAKQKVSSPTVPQNWRLCWGYHSKKGGVTLGLDHIYLLSLFDLYALRFGSLFGLLLKNPTPGFGEHLLGK